MESPDLFVGIDVGTTNLKVIACDGAGNVHAETSSPCDIEVSPEGYITQDPQAWLSGMDECFRRLGQIAELSTVRALSFSTQGETLVACDGAGEPLIPAISWMDMRATEESAELTRERNDWHQMTGKGIAAYGTLLKILWMRRHQPELYNRVRRFCQVADFVAAKVTGRWTCDINNASFTHYFDVAGRCWHCELLQRYELEGLLPEVAESGSTLGPPRPEIAQRWGIPETTQVILGGHDQSCSALASMPVDAPGVMLSTGTAWVLFSTLDHQIKNPDPRTVTYCFAHPGHWALFAAYSGGNVLDAFISKFCAHERRHAEEAGDSVYDRLIDLAHDPQDLLVIPFVFGANAPDHDPTARAAILNLDARHGPEHLIMAVLEAIAFETRRNLGLFAGVGIRPSRLVMLGGATQSAVWPQIVADACQCEVHVLELRSAAAVGAAWLACEALRDPAAPSAWKYPHTHALRPDPARAAKLEAKFNRYLRALDAERKRRTA